MPALPWTGCWRTALPEEDHHVVKDWNKYAACPPPSRPSGFAIGTPAGRNSPGGDDGAHAIEVEKRPDAQGDERDRRLHRVEASQAGAIRSRRNESQEVTKKPAVDGHQPLRPVSAWLPHEALGWKQLDGTLGIGGNRLVEPSTEPSNPQRDRIGRHLGRRGGPWPAL